MENLKKEYYYEATIKDAESGELIIRVSAFSQEGLEEEMGHSKWAEATKRYEEKLEKERLQDEEDRMDEEKTLPEDNYDKELEADDLADKKLEEGLAHEEDLEAEEELAASKENL